MGTNVLLVYANSFMDNLIPLGISILSACLKKAGHEVRLFDTTFYPTSEKTGDEAREETLQVKPTKLSDFGITPKETDMIEDFKKLVEEYRPQLIGVSCVETTYEIALSLLKSVENKEIVKLLGGIHVTFSPDEIIKEDCIDIICIGEGEKAIVELADTIMNKEDYSKIYNLWVKKDGEVIKNEPRPLINLNELPFQDWTIYEKKRFFKPMGGNIRITGTFELARGCPYNCAFCCNKKLKEIYRGIGNYCREKSITRFSQEMDYLVKKIGVQYVYIVAENFLQMNDERFNEFIAYYKKVHLPFWIETRPETVTEERILRLKEVGCEGISIGLESGNEEFRRKILNRFVSNETIMKAFEIARKTNIRISSNNIIGFPTETRELVFDTIEINRRVNPSAFIVNIFCPYRGTILRDLCIEKGYIKKDSIAGDYRFYAGLDQPQLTRQQVLGLQRTFPLYVKFPKDQWPKIREAEENDDVFKELRNIYLEKYV